MADISIIIPCYNVSQYIDRCLMSIINQTFGIKRLQIICIDDASTDDTLQHLQNWEQKYPDNIILIPLKTNSRQGTARNIGLQYVSSEWTTFIDADDWIEPDYCELMFTLGNEFECDIVRCNMLRDPSKSLAYFSNRTTNIANQCLIVDTMEKRKLFLSSHLLGHTSCDKLIRTKLLTENHIYFAESLAYEEIPWHTLLHIYTHKVFILVESLYHYFINPDSTTSVQNLQQYTDILSSCLIAWTEWKNRGLLGEYKEELEYNFVYYSYLYFTRNLLSSCSSYSLYLLARELTLQHVPDFSTNSYLNNCHDPIHKLLLQSLAFPFSQSQYLELVNQPCAQN